ncbi:hypothetical protein FNV43_RR05959 [Rhamnella rubrinervis]|uniref:Protein FAR1-RELATED SEQUENCE n=1 Tax=Rhamnella rubrinervis TaxID=2594499 RepID=A0A8K0HDK9_9ROSA|nr:hypothetical protein FNV43_RR05959 [Rhamnella rubrinervis]
MDFRTRCNRVVCHQRHEELVADHKDMNEQPKLTSLWPMETQMAKIYTKVNFLSFQKEMFESAAYILNCTLEDDETALYNVQRIEGNKYLITRHAQLSQLASMVVDDACLTVEGTNVLFNELELVHRKIKEMHMKEIVVSSSIGKVSGRELKSINNPTHVRSKGCGKRLKSSKEMSILKSRFCRGCGLRGQSHDKRNCPKLHERSTMNDFSNDSESANDENLTSEAGVFHVQESPNMQEVVMEQEGVLRSMEMHDEDLNHLLIASVFFLLLVLLSFVFNFGVILEYQSRFNISSWNKKLLIVLFQPVNGQSTLGSPVMNG